MDQFSSVTQSCLTLCDPLNCSTPGLPVPHHLPEFTQTHVYRVSDAIQLSHPLSSRFLLPPIPPSIRVFSNESTLRMRCPKYWSFSFSIIPSKEHPGLISFRMDWLDLLAVHGYTLSNHIACHREIICHSKSQLMWQITLSFYFKKYSHPSQPSATTSVSKALTSRQEPPSDKRLQLTED